MPTCQGGWGTNAWVSTRGGQTEWQRLADNKRPCGRWENYGCFPQINKFTSRNSWSPLLEDWSHLFNFGDFPFSVDWQAIGPALPIIQRLDQNPHTYFLLLHPPTWGLSSLRGDGNKTCGGFAHLLFPCKYLSEAFASFCVNTMSLSGIRDGVLAWEWGQDSSPHMSFPFPARFPNILNGVFEEFEYLTPTLVYA